MPTSAATDQRSTAGADGPPPGDAATAPGPGDSTSAAWREPSPRSRTHAG